MDKYIHIGISEDKIDSLALATASEKFTDDFPITNPLHCALLSSPLAHAEIVKMEGKSYRLHARARQNTSAKQSRKA